jgi:hypothetical protein
LSEVKQEKTEGHQKPKSFVFFSLSPVGLHEIEGRLKPPFSSSGFPKPLRSRSRRMLHPLWMKQRDLKNPSCRISSAFFNLRNPIRDEAGEEFVRILRFAESRQG